MSAPLQAEAAYAQGKEKAAGAADYAKQSAQQAADATYNAAGQAKEQVWPFAASHSRSLYIYPIISMQQAVDVTYDAAGQAKVLLCAVCEFFEQHQIHSCQPSTRVPR